MMDAPDLLLPHFSILPLTAYNQKYDLVYDASPSTDSSLRSSVSSNLPLRYLPAKDAADSCDYISEEVFSHEDSVHPSMRFNIALHCPPFSPYPSTDSIDFCHAAKAPTSPHNELKSKISQWTAANEKLHGEWDDQYTENWNLKVFDGYIMKLFQNFSLNFSNFHQNIDAILNQKNRANGKKIIEAVLRCYSFRFRDILIKTYNALVERSAEVYFKNQMQVLFETIQIYDLFHILFLCPLEDLVGNLMLWYKLFMDTSANNKFLMDLNSQIDRFLDSDSTLDVEEFSNHLCRLIGRVEIPHWAASVRRLFPKDSAILAFTKSLEKECVGTLVSCGNYQWKTEKYVQSMEAVQSIASRFMEKAQLSSAHLLYKSIQLLMGERSYLESCSSDWIESFISHLYWAVAKIPLTVNYHWKMISQCMVSKFSETSLNSVGYIIWVLLSTNDALKSIHLLAYDKILYKEFGDTASYLFPHILDVLFMNGSLSEAAEDAGAALHANTLISYGRCIKGLGLEESYWEYVTVADTHPSVRQDTIKEIKDLLGKKSIREFSHFKQSIKFVESLKILMNDLDQKCILVLEALKFHAYQLSDSGDTIGEAIKLALYFDLYCQESGTAASIARESIITVILRKYSKQGAPQCMELIRLFCDQKHEYYKIKSHVNSRIYNFFHVCAYVFPNLEKFSQIVSLKMNSGEVLEWIEENHMLLRTCVYLLFRMPEDIGWKSIDEGGTPLALVPIIIEEACKILEVILKLDCYTLVSEQDRSALLCRWRYCLQRSEACGNAPRWGDQKRRRVERALLLTTGKVANETHLQLLGDIHQIKQFVQQLGYGIPLHNEA